MTWRRFVDDVLTGVSLPTFRYESLMKSQLNQRLKNSRNQFQDHEVAKHRIECGISFGKFSGIGFAHRTRDWHLRIAGTTGQVRKTTIWEIKQIIHAWIIYTDTVKVSKRWHSAPKENAILVRVSQRLRIILLNWSLTSSLAIVLTFSTFWSRKNGTKPIIGEFE